jgi:hypothetical protein
MVFFAPTLAPTNLELISILWHARTPAHCGANACFPLAPARDIVPYCVLTCLARWRVRLAYLC